MPRPYRAPLGIPGAIALSVPPVALCLLSIFLADELTKQVSLGSIVAGLAIYGLTAKRKRQPIPAPDRPKLSI